MSDVSDVSDPSDSPTLDWLFSRWVSAMETIRDGDRFMDASRTLAGRVLNEGQPLAAEVAGNPPMRVLESALRAISVGELWVEREVWLQDPDDPAPCLVGTDEVIFSDDVARAALKRIGWKSKKRSNG